MGGWSRIRRAGQHQGASCGQHGGVDESPGGAGHREQHPDHDAWHQVADAIDQADQSETRGRGWRAREEERRRLRRDLHDGLGPSLAGITMEIQAARNLLEVDRRTAADMLDAAEGWARDAIAEVRRVVYGLRPPVLDQLGLTRALEEHAKTIKGSADGAPISVEVAVTGNLDSLPAAVELAAYLIALEGVTNVLRHAAARRCEIRMEASGHLRVEVVDDGTGVPDTHALGVGLTSMRERAEELGGSFSIARARPRGTRLVAEIPLVPV